MRTKDQNYNCFSLTYMKKGTKSQDVLEKELREINSKLNTFLKHSFTLQLQCLQEYLHNVKDLLIELTTHKLSPLLTNVFSKFSNILQPFTSYSYDISLDSLKEQISSLQEQNLKLVKKVHCLKQSLQQYRTKSNCLTQFVYMLRCNNINIDELYKRGVMNKGAKVHLFQEYIEDMPRSGLQFRRQDLLSGLQDDSYLTSQYIPAKSER